MRIPALVATLILSLTLSACGKKEESATPETAAPEVAAPEKAAPETAAPEVAASETAASETAASEMTAPEMVAPEAAAPETAASETATPETAAPETAVPETAAPEAASCCGSEAAAPSAAPEPASTASAPATDAAFTLAAAGKELYSSRCTGCHGLKAEGQSGFPRLAGLSSDEISNKLKAYRAGKQMGPRTAIMAASAKNLTDEDIAALAAYLGSLGK